VDIERVQRCDEAFAASIQTPRERVALPVQGDRDRHFTSLWSGKEALSKALGDALAYDPRRLEGPLGWPDGRSGPWRAARLEVGAEHVAWVCWRHA
jgi:phosphopantetheinyl transferase (holo-ACP synthase)